MRQCGYYVKFPVSYFYHICCRSSHQWIHGEVITSHSGKIGWRLSDGGRGFLGQTNTAERLTAAADSQNVWDKTQGDEDIYDYCVTPKRSVVENWMSAASTGLINNVPPERSESQTERRFQAEILHFSSPGRTEWGFTLHPGQRPGFTPTLTSRTPLISLSVKSLQLLSVSQRTRSKTFYYFRLQSCRSLIWKEVWSLLLCI